ncbi:Mur ligase family protein, partial [Adlercreutzia sp. DFI.6.23]|uniref:Mur ligase family protein n=1 Tax=Adlercreutzia sp. DFI.6.23 TaxID=2963705 RepID=UPI00210B22FC
AGNTDVYVAETSSYQLASTRLFAPDVALVLNITPDHLYWRGSLEAYAAAKWKVLANLGVSGGVAVLDACDDAVRAKIRELRAGGGVPFRYIPIGGASGL